MSADEPRRAAESDHIEQVHVGVAEFNGSGERTSRVHRPRHVVPAGPRRNRSQYRVRCGRVVRMGKPVASAPAGEWCAHCYPPGQQRADGAGQ